MGIALLVSFLGVSLADWFFWGVLFHDRYDAFPEVWRYRGAGSAQRRAVAGGVVLGAVTCAAFVGLCSALHVVAWKATLSLAFGTWMSTAVPMVLTNWLFIKMHPLLVVSGSLGWLAKLIIPAIAVSLLM